MMQELNATAHKVLDVAEHYTQTRGFNAFSYKDLQNEVGVKTSSIHYYFPSKQDLALSMIERYTQGYIAVLNSLTQQHSDGVKRLIALGNVYVNPVKEGKFCICGMLASDMLSLPDIVHNKLCHFFQVTEQWIAEAIELAKQQGSIKPSINTETSAATFLAMLEGGMLIARIQKQPTHLETIVAEAISQLTR